MEIEVAVEASAEEAEVALAVIEVAEVVAVASEIEAAVEASAEEVPEVAASRMEVVEAELALA